MNALSENPSLKEINAYKKQLNWGEIPAIYHMAATAVGDIDGILTHGFDSAYKQLLNKNNWNLPLLGGSKDQDGNIEVQRKPQIMLQHVFNETHYELHCFPVISGGYINTVVRNNPKCPFKTWIPEKNQMLFRLANFINFMIYCVKKGDEADLALVKFAYLRIEYLIEYLGQFFDVVNVKGKSISHMYADLEARDHSISNDELFVIPINRDIE